MNAQRTQTISVTSSARGRCRWAMLLIPIPAVNLSPGYRGASVARFVVNAHARLIGVGVAQDRAVEWSWSSGGYRRYDLPAAIPTSGKIFTSPTNWRFPFSTRVWPPAHTYCLVVMIVGSSTMREPNLGDSSCVGSGQDQMRVSHETYKSTTGHGRLETATRSACPHRGRLN